MLTERSESLAASTLAALGVPSRVLMATTLEAWCVAS
jgi:hypothetical protein